MKLSNSTRGKIQIRTDEGYIERVADNYPDGFSIVNYRGVYYALETSTGVAFYSMTSVYDLAATLRDPENDSAIRERLEKIRSEYPAVNI